MCDTMNSTLISYYAYGDNGKNIHKFGPTLCKLNSNPTFLPSRTTMECKDHLLTSLVRNPSKKEHKLCVYSSNGYDFDSDLGLKEDNELGLEFSKDIEDIDSLHEQKDGNFDEFEALDIDEALKGKAKNRVFNGEDDGVEEVKLKRKEELGLKSRRKQLIKRSNLIAKQVIGVQSAFSLGFVSQLWVDTASWVVLEVEVRPSLLSSESGKVLVQDIERVGDVMLIQDETFVLNEFRTVGLETLVGYSVVTPKGRSLGKVRGYTFNINSGAVEFLELDAFGFPIISSSLVSTYALFTEDVLQVLSDTIIVHETAASNIQRLTKGFFSMMKESSNFNTEYDDLYEESRKPVKSRKSRRKSSKRRPYPGTRNVDDDLDLPMDYM